MGFSISGTFAILALVAFVAIGTFLGAADQGFERVSDAQRAAADDRLEQRNTRIDVTRATWQTGLLADRLVVEVENTGATTLPFEGVDLVVDNVYVPRSAYDAERVGPTDTGTELWLPGETYHVEVERTALDDRLGSFPPDRVKVVVGPGVADAREVVVS